MMSITLNLNANELVINSSFNNGTNNWNSVDSTLSVENAKLKVSSTGRTGRAVQNIDFVAGEIYELTGYQEGSGSIVCIYSNTYIDKECSSIGEDGNFNLTFEPTVSGFGELWLRVHNSYSSTGYFDNISIKQISSIIPDTIKPVLSSTSKTFTTTVGTLLSLETVTANDNIDGNLIVTQSGTVDFYREGTYSITYSATDSSNNSSSIIHTYIVESLIDTGLVLNGDFHDGTNNWNSVDSTLSVENAKLKVESTHSTGRAVQKIEFIAGEIYEITGYQEGSGSIVCIYSNTYIDKECSSIGEDGNFNLTFEPTVSGFGELWLRVDNRHANTGYFDNISLKQVSVPPRNTGQSHLYTASAKAKLKSRFENGYVLGAGFSDDITFVKKEVADFVAYPSEFRPTFGYTKDVRLTILSSSQNLHFAGVQAYATDDINIANEVAKEMLATINANINTFRDDAYWTNNTYDQGDRWVQASKAKKMRETFHFIKDLQTVWSESDIAKMNTWFKDFADIAYASVKATMENQFGTNWQNVGISKLADSWRNVPHSYGTSNPIYDSSGKSLYTMTLSQDFFNNRYWDAILYFYSIALEDENTERIHWTREFFKASIKYGLFPDGTWWEMVRSIESKPALGVFYGTISLGAMVEIAHLDAMTNLYPNDRLYDYETSDGIEYGSTNLTSSPYQGSSTTNGITKKSLKTFIKGQSKYMRNNTYDGWNDTRFFKKSNGSLLSLNPTGKYMPSVQAAIANLYYKDSEIEDYYKYNHSAGYPQKQSLYEGYTASYYNEDMGAWGNNIFGAMWFEMENNFNFSE